MADSELGELRRPPRTLEQRLERASRWRREGMAAGTADTLYPAITTDDLVFASSGAGGDAATSGAGAAPQWFADTFNIAVGFDGAYNLTFVPVPFSEVVRLNGLTLTPTVDYTIAADTVTLTDPVNLGLGLGSDTWDLTVSYAYFDSVGATASEFGYVADMDSPKEIPEPVLAGDVALLAVNGRATAVTGVYATWTKVYDSTGSASNAGFDLWIGTGIGSGTQIGWTIGGVTEHGRALAVFRNITGTVSVRNVSVDSVSTPITVPTFAAPPVTAVVGDIVISVLRCPGGTYPDDPGLYVSTGFDPAAVRSYITGIYANGIGIAAGIATATSVQTTFAQKFSANSNRTLTAANISLQVTP